MELVYSFNLELGVWRQPIDVFGLPGRIAADDDALYLAYTDHITRFDRRTAESRTLDSPQVRSYQLFAFPQALIVVGATKTGWAVMSLDKTTGALFDRRGIPELHPEVRLDACFEHGLIYGVTRWHVEAIAIRTNDDGTFSDVQVTRIQVPLHGDGFGPRTVLLPDCMRALTTSGVLLSTQDSRFIAQVTGALWRPGFVRDHLLNLTPSHLEVYSPGFALLKRIPLEEPYCAMYATEANVYLFGGFDQVEPQILVFRVDQLLESGQPRPGPDPRSDPWSIDGVAMQKSGTLYFLANAHSAVHIWDVPNRRWLSSIRLARPAVEIAYAGASDELYIGYPEGEVEVRSGKNPYEEPRALPRWVDSAPEVLLPAGDILVVWLETGRVLAVDPRTGPISDIELAPVSSAVWSEGLSSVFFVTKEVVFKDGAPQGFVGRIKVDSGRLTEPVFAPIDQPRLPGLGFEARQPPIRVSSSGQYVLLGSGFLFDAETFEVLDDPLAYPLIDAIADPDTIFSLRALNTGIGEVLKWTGQRWSLTARQRVSGLVERIFRSEEAIIIPYRRPDGLVRIEYLSVEDLSVLPAPVPFIRGDANGDGVRGLTDALAILAFLFLAIDNPVAAVCPEALDVDADGSLTVTDPVTLLLHLYAGYEIPEPRRCYDPAGPQLLGCTEHSACKRS